MERLCPTWVRAVCSLTTRSAAIRVVADGGSLFGPSVTRRLIAEFRQRARPGVPPPELAQLTARELEVFGLIARGLSNHEIAAELVGSEHTARTHVGHILSKLDLRDSVQAVGLAYSTGLIVPDAGGGPGRIVR